MLNKKYVDGAGPLSITINRLPHSGVSGRTSLLMPED